MQTFIWFFKILPFRASDHGEFLLCFYKYIQSQFGKNSADAYQKNRISSACFDVSLDYQFLFCAACIWKYVQNLAFYFSYMEAVPFAWIDIVCWGLMNGQFNQELSILQIPEKDWIHSYTAELCRRAFMVIEGREVIKQHKI